MDAHTPRTPALNERLVQFIVREIRATGLVRPSREPELREALERLANEDKESS